MFDLGADCSLDQNPTGGDPAFHRLEGAKPAAAYAGTVGLQAGDTIDFAIGCLVMGIFVTIYNYASFRLIAPTFNLTTTETGLIFSAYVFGIVEA